MKIYTAFLYLLLNILLLGGCASVVYSTNDLPDLVPKFEIEAFDPLQTPIGEVYASTIAADSSQSGAILLDSGQYALLHRIALTRMATHTIELQTYIYEDDVTSGLLLLEMEKAAERGVKVRIIVDDNGLGSDQSAVMLLNYHPNIEVKVFNPFKYRARISRYPQMLFDLGRLNYRMHNKLFIVDDAAVIIGGRNVAGNYFDNDASVNFSDTDVLFLGGLAREAVTSFNEYWNYHKAIPVSAFPNQDEPERLDKMNKEVIGFSDAHPELTNDYENFISGFVESFKEGNFHISWGKGVLVGDDPAKTEGNMPESPIIEMTRTLMKASKESIYLASAYFVPGKTANREIMEASKNGLEINILTNSLSSTDVKLVYAGWMRYRDDLLKNGVNVYEFRNEGYKVENHKNSGASLHSKVMVFDDNIAWVGSFNLDPRSAALDSEVVAAFYSEEFAEILKKRIQNDMSYDKSWTLAIEDGDTVWKTERNGKVITVDHSPDSSLLLRMFMSIMSVFVPESLL